MMVRLADSITVYTNNFLDGQGQYNGEYKESVFNPDFFIYGDIINTGRPSQWSGGQLHNCHVDYSNPVVRSGGCID